MQDTYFGVAKIDVFVSSSKDLRLCGMMGVLALLSKSSMAFCKPLLRLPFD